MARNDLWNLGPAMWRNAIRLGETAVASDAVIRHRSGMMGAAFQSPMDADMGEFSRMVVEKMVAFSEAGWSLFHDMAAMQVQVLEQSAELAAMYWGGRAPSPARLRRAGRRATRLAAQGNAAAGRALAPIHAAATANARRLKG